MPAALFVLVPLELLFIRTQWFHLPQIITPSPQQWNVQYLPFVAISGMAAVVGFVAWQKLKPAKTLFASALINLVWAAAMLYAVVTLWGEKV